MALNFLAAAIPLAAKGYMAWKGGKDAERMANAAALAAQQAMEARRQRQQEALKAQEAGYSEALGYLQPYNDPRYANLLADTAGLSGPNAQLAALNMYKGTPSFNLLQEVLNQTERRIGGNTAAGGLWNSGAHAEELGRRLSDITLGDYYKHRGLLENRANRGQAAATNMSTVARDRGNAFASTLAGIGNTEATGILGRTAALNRGVQGRLNYLEPFVSGIGEAANDLFGMPSSGGGKNPMASELFWQQGIGSA